MHLPLPSNHRASLMEGEDDESTGGDSHSKFKTPHSDIMRAENRCPCDFSERCLARGEALSFPSSAAF